MDNVERLCCTNNLVPSPRLSCLLLDCLLVSKMSFYCAISGEPPQDPVLSRHSGQVFERRLIIKYIAENGTDPTTGEKLEESDLVPIKNSALKFRCSFDSQFDRFVLFQARSRPPLDQHLQHRSLPCFTSSKMSGTP